MIFGFIIIYTISHTQRVEKSASLSFKLYLLTLPRLKTRQLIERALYTDIFRAPSRAVRALLQRKTSVTIILNAPFAKGVPLRAARVASQLRMTVTATLRAFRDWESALRVSVICKICNICKEKKRKT